MVWVGKGRNGKSTLALVLRGVLGSYAGEVSSNMLLSLPVGRGGDEARRNVPLIGLRLTTVRENESGRQWDEARVKQLVDCDELRARLLYAEEFGFIPSHTMVLHTNHAPGVRDGGLAFWRRMLRFDFKVTLAEGEVLDHYERALLEEADGILAWAIRGSATTTPTGCRTALLSRQRHAGTRLSPTSCSSSSTSTATCTRSSVS